MMQFNNLLQQKLNSLKEQGSYRSFLEVNKSSQHFPSFYYTNAQGVQRSAVNWCSNDYLCMSTNEDVIAKLSFVAHRSGTGSSGTRNIAGTTTHHLSLEKTLANWHNKEAALLFNGAYQANFTTLQTIGTHLEDVVFLSDENNHASLIEGIKASGKPKYIFRHNSVEHLEHILQQLPYQQIKIIVAESVYSMSGTVAPLTQITQLAKKYNAITYIDEVHAIGLYGNTGAGLIEQLYLQHEVDIVNGTLAKAVGTLGGYIVSSAVVIDFIRSFGKGFIFTTSLPPAICEAANKSIQIIQSDTTLRNVFFQQVQLLRSALENHQISYSGHSSHITIITIGKAQLCKQIANDLLHVQGVYLQPINFPTVAKGKECLRIIITPKHLPKHINHLAYSLQKIIYANLKNHRQSFQAINIADAKSEA